MREGKNRFLKDSFFHSNRFPFIFSFHFLKYEDKSGNEKRFEMEILL
jgi:hypothetical protein